MKPQTDSQRATVVTELQRSHRAGVMVLLFTDMVGSAQLKDDLGDLGAAELIVKHHALVRTILARYPTGQEIDTAGDSFFITFSNASDAVRFALQLQAELRRLFQDAPHPVRDRIGIHAGEVLVQVTKSRNKPRELIGIHVDTCARVMSICPADRILITRFAFDNARQALKGQSVAGVGTLRWESHGLFKVKGVDGPLEICEVADADMTRIDPLEQAEKVEPLGALSESGSEWPGESSFGPAVDSGGGSVRLSLRWAWRHGAVGAALVLSATFLALVTPLAEFLDHLSYDSAYLFRHPPVPDEAVVIYMDDASRAALGQESDARWDRSLHANLIDRLTASHARAVVFDLVLDATNQVQADKRLLLAARRNGRVFMGADVQSDKDADGITTRRQLIPFATLRNAAKFGLVEQGRLTDNMVRKLRNWEEDIPPLAQVVAESTSGQRPARSAVAHWFHFYGPPLALPHWSYEAAIDTNRVLDSALSNRVVFVGANMLTPGGRTDMFRTPYSRWRGGRSPGVEINATAYLNTVRQDYLLRLNAGTQLEVFVVLGVFTAFGLTLLRPIWAVTIGIGTALLVAIFARIWVWHSHVWFAWAVISAVQLPCGVAWAVLAETQRLRQALERLTAARRLVTNAASKIRGRRQKSAPEGISQPASPVVPDYKLLSPIGRGGYGEVWIAQDVTGNYGAIKIVYRSWFRSAKPFEREFEGVRKFSPVSRSHPNLINVLHVGRNEKLGYFYYSMELADDERTGSKIRPADYLPRTLSARTGRAEPWSLARAVRLGIQLSGALQCLHDHGLVHRDVKPANVLFVRGVPKLADIGLVTELAQTGEEQSAVGTLGYMAPEGPGKPQADIYSLGHLLYQVRFGVKADESDQNFRADSGVADDPCQQRFREIVAKACAREQLCRWQTASALERALTELEQSMPRSAADPP